MEITFDPAKDSSNQRKRVGRPRLDTPKVAVTIRYDKAVIDAFKAGGPGWQTRMNEVLKKAVARKRA